jgi:hypothetical protein
LCTKMSGVFIWGLIGGVILTYARITKRHGGAAGI